MLETTYVLVIDTKNLLDTLDEVRLQTKMIFDPKLSDDDEKTTDTAVEESQSSTNKDETSQEEEVTVKKQQPQDTKIGSEYSNGEKIYANDGVEAN